MKKLFLAALLALAIVVGADASDEKGHFGFRVDVETSGFVLSPTVKSVIIKSIVPDSPAAVQHLAVGDEILEADGHAVPGGKALELKSIMQKRPGETIHLKLKRAGGESYSVALTAVKQPG